MDFDFQNELDSVVRGITNVIDNEPQLRQNILRIATEKVEQVSRSYIGTSGPRAHPWQPLSQKTIDKKGHDKPLIETGEMQGGIKATVHWGYATITSDRSKFSPSVHEFGYGKIPARPFVWPAIEEVQRDITFWSTVTKYSDENIEFMAFDKRKRVSQIFFSDNKGQVTSASVTKKTLRKKSGGKIAKRKIKRKKK